MRDFDFLQPATVAEASRLAAEHGDEARFIAGGTALMLALRQRLASPAVLVSLARLAPLRGIALDDGGADGGASLRLGALTLHAELAESDLVRRQLPALAGLASRMANPQVRHQGTLGGNLCYGDPSTDPPTLLLALDARVLLASYRGERELPLGEFLVDYYTTALDADELLVAVRVPLPAGAGPGETRTSYHRHLRTAADHRPMASVAAQLRVQDGVCLQAALALGAATPVARRLPQAEALLAGRRLSARLIDDVARAVAGGIEPLDDLRGSADYRRDIVRVITRRTLAGLAGRPDETERASLAKE